MFNIVLQNLTWKRFILFLIFIVIIGSGTSPWWYNHLINHFDSKNASAVYLSGDFIFNTKEIKDNSFSTTVNVDVEANKGMIILLKKGEIIEQYLEEYIFEQIGENAYIGFDFRLLNVSPKDIILQKGQKSSIKLEFDSFGEINLNDVFESPDDDYKHKIGWIRVKLYYMVKNEEKSKIVEIPIFLVCNNSN